MNIKYFKKIDVINILSYLGFAILILSSKLILVTFYGNAIPVWDQWDAEADHLYRPWIEGSLQWLDFFLPHNEHRIFTTRLLALFLLELNNKIWNPILQMQVNAILHITALSVLLFHLNKLLSKNNRAILFIFSALLFSIPFGWENTLSGFQSQFYFLLLFSFIFLWSMSTYEIYKAKWWLGVLAGILSLLSLASGALTILAGTLILLIRKITIKDKIPISSILLLLTITVLAISLTPTIPVHAALKAQSAGQFLLALFKIASWPEQKIGIAFLIIQSPLLLFATQILLNKKYQAPPFIFIIAMTAWLLGQFISIAYGRAIGETSSRYLDIFSIGLLLNFSALIFLSSHDDSRHKSLYRMGIIIWLIFIISGFLGSSNKLLIDLQTKKIQSLEQEKNVRAYLCSDDITHLQNKPFLFIPYPNAERLKSLLDNPAIRTILPENIHRHNPLQTITSDGEPFCDPGSLIQPFSISKWDNDISNIVTTSSIKDNSNWLGSDYFKSTIPGLKIIGSLINSENDTGMITLHLHRGQKIIFRSGPRVAGQFILINKGGHGKFYTELPLSIEWSALEFSNSELPDEFDVTLIDASTKWGEWSAIALQSDNP
jgi:hypothetical protein